MATHRKIELVPATLEHAEYIAANVREMDAQEIWASSRQKPFHAMQSGIKYSDQAMTGLVDGIPVLMWGVVFESLVGNIGTPWMIATKHLDQHAVSFLRRCRKPVLDMMKKYDTLINHVDARNICAIRWLGWLGFIVEEQPKPYGVDDVPFHKFRMENNYV